MTGPALRVRGLTKAWETPVLCGVDLEVPAGSLVALLGPSGCGKTTLLRLVAGFDRPDSGSVEVAGREVVGPGRWTPPEQRRVAVVPQEGALFPHLTVAANAGFGLPRGERSGARAQRALALVGLAGLGDRMPHELSGGQQQRVAVARALAPEPSLVLLDEPFSALDATLRGQVREQVRESLRTAGASAVLVTHDQQEALSLADVVAVVRDGRVVQAAAPEVLYAEPVDLGVATGVGEAVVLRGTADGASVQTVLGRLVLRLPCTGRVDVVVRPEQLEVQTGGDGAVGAVVERRAFFGHDALLGLRLADGTQVLARTPGAVLPPAGSEVGVVCRGEVSAFPAAPA